MRILKRRTRRRLLVLAVAAVAVVAYGAGRDGGPIFGKGGIFGAGGESRGISGPVVSVADGDTLSVRTAGGRVERVRLIGIDTPEVYGGVECGGPEASAAMKRLAAGARVTVVPDPTQDRRDRYGRLLGYVERGGTDLGLEMIRRGLAGVYVYGRPFRRHSRYRRAEREARDAGRGSWPRCRMPGH